MQQSFSEWLEMSWNKFVEVGEKDEVKHILFIVHLPQQGTFYHVFVTCCCLFLLTLFFHLFLLERLNIYAVLSKEVNQKQ